MRAHDQQVRIELARHLQDRCEDGPLHRDGVINTQSLVAKGLANSLDMLTLSPQGFRLRNPFDVSLELGVGTAAFQITDKLRIRLCDMNKSDKRVMSPCMAFHFHKHAIHPDLEIDSR